MQGQRKYSLHTIIFGIALILFCLVIISTYMMSGLYARYRSAGDSPDGARVAGFSVDAKWTDDIVIDVTSIKGGSYKLTLTNQSEVAVRYGLTLTFANDVSSFMQVKLNGTTGTFDGNTVKFENIGELPANAASSDTAILTFEITSVDAFTKPATTGTYEQTYSFNALITCTQID